MQGHRRTGSTCQAFPRPTAGRRVAGSFGWTRRPNSSSARGWPQSLWVAAIIACGGEHRRQTRDRWVDIGPSEAETFWSSFLKSLARRGLQGVKLVISDAHEGLKAAIRRVFAASWQRCRVHWMRNALSYVAKTQQSMVAAGLRQAFDL